MVNSFRGARPGTRPESHLQADRGIHMTILGAFLLLGWDIGFTGSYILSLLCCPVWLFVILLKCVTKRANRRCSLASAAIATLTLCLVLANNSVQTRIAEANALKIIEACEQFSAFNGRYPNSLDELVPRFIPSVPRAKYCLAFGEFRYFNHGRPMLVWCETPPYGRRVYEVDTQRQSYID